MEELKPCPFCGGKAELIQDETVLSFTRVRCIDADCFAGYGMVFPDKEKLIAAWNTRAERTCEIIFKSNDRPGKTVCNIWFACSECGYPMSSDNRYCAHCGAKVRKVVE